MTKTKSKIQEQAQRPKSKPKANPRDRFGDTKIKVVGTKIHV